MEVVRAFWSVQIYKFNRSEHWFPLTNLPFRIKYDKENQQTLRCELLVDACKWKSLRTNTDPNPQRDCEMFVRWFIQVKGRLWKLTIKIKLSRNTSNWLPKPGIHLWAKRNFDKNSFILLNIDLHTPNHEISSWIQRRQIDIILPICEKSRGYVHVCDLVSCSVVKLRVNSYLKRTYMPNAKCRYDKRINWIVYFFLCLFHFWRCFTSSAWTRFIN